MNTLRCLPLRAWMTLVLVTTLCAPVATAAQSSPSPSVEEGEASVGLDRAQRKRVQLGLRALGFNPGAADGLFGPRTRKAIGQWQSSRGEPSTGYLDANSASTLLEAGGTAGESAADLIAEALSITRNITDAKTRARALSTIAGAQTETGDLGGAARSIAEALNIARSIGDADSRVRALSSIAGAQATVGDIAEALSTARSIGDDSWADIALGRIAEAQAKAGDIAGALKTARSMGEDSGWQANALGEIATAQLEADDITAALNTARNIGDAKDRSRQLTFIAQAQAEAGDTDGARIFIAEALTAAARIKGDTTRDLQLSSIAQTQAETGDIAEALSTRRSIGDESQRAEALAYIAAGQAKAGESHGANRSMAEALSTARSIGDDWTLGAVAEAQANAGNVTEALSTVRSIGEGLSRDVALVAIAEAQLEAGDITAALNTARSIGEDYGFQVAALVAIAEAELEAGDITATLNTARSIGDESQRARALAYIAVKQAKAGENARPAPSPAEEEGSRPTRPVAEQAKGAGTPCEGWNTAAFFRQAGTADVIRCLETNDPNARDPKARTPLHAAAMVSNEPSVVAALAKAGATLDARDEKGRTPLHLAAGLATTSATVTALVSAGAALDARDEKGRTPLQIAETFSEAPAVMNALREATQTAGASSAASAGASCDNWNTGAFFARADGATVPRCLDGGANVHARDDTGATPLHTAAGHSQEAAVVSALLSAGARLGARDETGATPLHTAAAKGTSAAVVEALLDAGADTAAKDETGRTPGDYVADNPALAGADAAGRLAGASCDDWNTARFFEHAHAATVSRCLDEGADVRASDANGMTPLHFAAAHTRAPGAIRALLEAGADASAMDSQGKVAWYHARDNPALKGTEAYWRLNEERFN